MSPINLAIFGLGEVADKVRAPSIRCVPGVQLWSVLSRDLGRAREFARRHEAASPDPAHTDIHRILADPHLHAVLITSPDASHAEQAIAAMRAGKHVFVEKPMAVDAASAESMLRVSIEANVRLGVAYRLRWHVGHRQLFSRLCVGEIGELIHSRFHYSFFDKDHEGWRAKGELSPWWCLGRAGTHVLDFARWLMQPTCGEVQEIRGLISGERWKRATDETALAALRFESGATSEIYISVLFDSESRGEIYGTKGSVVMRDTLTPAAKGQILVNGTELAFDSTNPFHEELADFVAAIREDRSPEVGGLTGVWNVCALLGVHNPYASSAWIDPRVK